MKWNHKIKKGVYYKTEHWRERRKEAIEDAGGMCDECGSVKELHVHHRNYNSLFKEKDRDLIVLCKKCHEDLHGKIFDLEDDADD